MNHSTVSSLIRYAILMVALAAISGCSISHSISSSSDSSTSISRSSTSSSGPSVSDETKKAYVKDVATYVGAIGQSQISSEEFMNGISSIAKRHGISDWESFDPTYEGIGQGLKNAGIGKEEIKELPYLKLLLSSNPSRLEKIQDAY
jgi:hypothetical protein